MIKADFKGGAMQLGETRSLRLSGDAPFSVTISCFVNDPPPPGFRPCEQCKVQSVFEGESLEVTADKAFWSDKTGRLEIKIVDSVGDRHRLAIQIEPHTRKEGMTATA